MTAVFVSVATPAFALETRVLEGSFGPDGTATSEFLYPWSLGVDQSTGSVYVASLDNTVVKFDSSHGRLPFASVGFGISSQANELAVNPISHDLYVVGGSSAVIAYQSDGEPANFTAGPSVGSNEIGGPEVCGVSADSNGDIYISEFATGIRVLAPSGEPLTNIPISGVCNLAVDTQGRIYTSDLHGPVEKLVPSEYPITSLTTYASGGGIVDPNSSLSVAVDPDTNDLYVDEGSQVAEYDEAGTFLGAFGAGGPDALAGSVGVGVNGTSGQVYVSNSEGNPRQVEIFGSPILLPEASTEKGSEINPKGTATLNGTVDPDGIEVTQCQFEYGTSASYGQTAACEQAVGSGTSGVPVTAKVTNLEPGKTYHFRLVASNMVALKKSLSDYGSDETFPTPPRPSIDATSTADLTANSVELQAQIDPNGIEVTECQFEYGTTMSYGQTVACEQAVGSGTSDVAVSRQLDDLQPNVTYYWRVVATGEAGVTTGVDQTFVYDTSGEGLPDNRAYEMVTPPQKNGAFISDVEFGIPADVAEDGSRLVIPSIQCFANAESCDANRGPVGTSYLFSRTTTGWTTTALAPPASQFEASSGWLVSAEAGTELFSMPTPPMSEDDFYVRQPNGSFVDIGPATPPSDGPVGLPWEGANIKATSDFSQVAYQEGHAWPFDESTGESTYEFSGTGNVAPELVGVTGGPSSSNLISACGTALGATANGEHPGEMSANGETVYFTAKACASGTGSNEGKPVPVNALYARIGETRTVAISEPSAFFPAAPYPGCVEEACIMDVNDPANWSEATLAGASNDGSKVFFTTGQRLTDDAGAGGNLYEYDFDSSSGETLTDISAGEPSAEGPEVQGVMAISSDGSHVYFVAKGVLTKVANQQGEAAQEGADNLYVFERDASDPRGQVAFIARLPEADREQWGGNDDYGDANVTPEGRYLVFESYGDLTSDDTRTNGESQIFRYDAQTGDLVRISVGERGFDDNGDAGVGGARIVSAWFGFDQAGPSRSDPTMSNDGSYVFFESPLGLTPHALSDVEIGSFLGEPTYAENVYEWHEGQVYLISDGRDTATVGNQERSAVSLLGSDATGDNVFFSTSDSLVPQDTDTQVDYYDARICSVTEPCASQTASSPPCVGEVCHGTPVGVPPLPLAPTATFNGQGDLSGSSHRVISPKGRRKKVAACHKGKVRKHGKCVSVKVRRKSAGKANSHKGAKGS